MTKDPWDIAVAQIQLPSFFGQFAPEKCAPGSYRPAKLDEIYQWFVDNPKSTITVLELIDLFNISNPSAYRVQRILLTEKKIFKHKFPGRKKGIAYGLHPQEPL